MTEDRTDAAGERADLLQALTTHRGFLLRTVGGLNDEQARERTTVSELTLGGLIKHVAATEEAWANFIVEGPSAMGGADDKDWSEFTQADLEAFADSFRLLPEETLAGAVGHYAEVARRTDGLVGTVDLDLSHPLPVAPWYEPGAVRSARRTLLHIIAETAQHAGHADIIRESLDGQKTMG